MNAPSIEGVVISADSDLYEGRELTLTVVPHNGGRYIMAYECRILVDSVVTYSHSK